MEEHRRLAEAEKQLRIVVEQNGNEPYSAELKRISERVSEIREGLAE